MNVIQAKEYLVRLNTNDDNVFYLITLLDYFLTGKVPENNETYKLLRNIALPIAGLGIAYCGFALIFGSEKDAEVSKKRIFYIALAIAVLFLLPAIINSVVDLVSQFAWDPESPAS